MMFAVAALIKYLDGPFWLIIGLGTFGILLVLRGYCPHLFRTDFWTTARIAIAWIPISLVGTALALYSAALFVNLMPVGTLSHSAPNGDLPLPRSSTPYGRQKASTPTSSAKNVPGPAYDVPEIPEDKWSTDTYIGKIKVLASAKPTGVIYVSVWVSRTTQYKGWPSALRIQDAINTINDLGGMVAFDARGGYSFRTETMFSGRLLIKQSEGIGILSIIGDTSPGTVYCFNKKSQDAVPKLLHALELIADVKKIGLDGYAMADPSDPGVLKRRDFITISGIDIEVVL